MKRLDKIYIFFLIQRIFEKKEDCVHWRIYAKTIEIKTMWFNLKFTYCNVITIYLIWNITKLSLNVYLNLSLVDHLIKLQEHEFSFAFLNR